MYFLFQMRYQLEWQQVKLSFDQRLFCQSATFVGGHTYVHFGGQRRTEGFSGGICFSHTTSAAQREMWPAPHACTAEALWFGLHMHSSFDHWHGNEIHTMAPQNEISQICPLLTTTHFFSPSSDTTWWCFFHNIKDQRYQNTIFVLF